MKVTEIMAKTMLVKSKLPDADYAVNPYVGCEFGCLYCYASFMGRFVNEPVENWGKYVYVKRNAVEVFERELRAMPESQRNASIFLSSVTDPYQGVEAEYKLTRGILQALAKEKYPGAIDVLTKSSLVLRDIDVLGQLPDCEVGMTVNTADDALGRFLEVRATSVSQRFSTLAKLHEERISTYASIGPLLPHYRYKPELLEDLFARLAESKVGYICVEHMNLRPYIRKRLFEALKGEPDEVQNVYRGAEDGAHMKILDGIVVNLAKKHHLDLAADEVIYHNRYEDGWRKTPIRIQKPLA